MENRKLTTIFFVCSSANQIEMVNTYSRAQVAQHNKSSDAWIIIDNVVFVKLQKFLNMLTSILDMISQNLLLAILESTTLKT